MLGDKLFRLKCYNCLGETKIIIQAPPVMKGKKNKKIQITRYCEHCNKPNLITVPEIWDEENPVLGDNVSSLGDGNDTSILQGEQVK